jgi:hypothetical protein
MLYYFLSVFLLAGIFIYQYITLNRIYQTQKALESFREIRHAVILNLADNVKEKYSLQEVAEHREFLNKVDSIIRHFDKFSTKMIKFTSVKWVYTNIIFSSQKYKEIKDEHAESLEPYKAEVGNTVFNLFKAIPFLKPRILIYLAKIIASLFMALGITMMKNSLRRLERLNSARDEVTNNDSMSCFR